MTEVLAVVGPTASGKTALAIALAERLGTEIISADSMQFYRGMEIGTGAPSAGELARVKHHFAGFLDPGAEMSAGLFQSLARPVVAELNERAKIAVAVGGSGLYLRALLDGLFSGPGRDPAVRERLAAEAETLGAAALHARLRGVDPAYADTIGENDARRIVRALEVYELTGKPFSELHETWHEAEPLDTVQIALEWPREILYERIDRRVDAMIAAGLVEEVQRLMDQGHETTLEQLKSLGYREIMAYIRNETSMEHATEHMKLLTRRLAKRQLSWFRQDERIHWLPAQDRDVEDLADAAMEVAGLA